MVKNSFKSVISIFGDSKKDQEKKKSQFAGDKKGATIDPSSSRMSMTSMNMSMDQSYQMQGNYNTESLEYQIRYAFFTHFKSAEDVYRYLVDVGRVLVNEREKITQLFKRVQ